MPSRLVLIENLTQINLHIRREKCAHLLNTLPSKSAICGWNLIGSALRTPGSIPYMLYLTPHILLFAPRRAMFFPSIGTDSAHNKNVRPWHECITDKKGNL
ncbi:hypothetical protein Y032_0017g3399 [Ancylostoma ceylanicum]|uniref:Uncharacterized protein n=1 Tax=Ancylostoma ceylanicum TaxID=53326 RepID=A0A016V505_9BILA|nr:hypothetical protein Y032_0017g3399 [Ancylostoma ceylanicum]